MKRSLAVALLTAVGPTLAYAASGGTPLTMSQSGYVLDAQELPLSSGSQPFVFRVFAAAAPVGGETAEWEAACSLAVQNGYYAVVLGAAPCAGGSVLDTADLPPGQVRWLEIAVGGVTLAPRLQLASVATSVLAADALKLGGIAAGEYVLAAELGAGGAVDIDAARLTSGTLPSGRLAGTYGGALTLTNAANVLSGDGAALTNLSADQLLGGTVPGARLAGTYANALTFSNASNAFTGSGAGLTGLNASSLASGTIPSARLSGTYGNDLTLTGSVQVTNGLAIPNGADLPASAGAAGSVFFRTSDGTLHASTGSAWVAVTGGGGSSGWPLGSAGNPAASCSAIKAAAPTSASSAYYLLGPNGGYQAWCDMDTDGGGWTLVMSATDASRWRGQNTIWTDTTWDGGTTVTPSSPGKSFAYLQVTGDQVLFKTHNEASGRWASFDLPAVSTFAGLVGTTPVLSLTAGTYQKTLTGRALGSAAHPCWGGDWRVMWRGYYSADASPDSAIFAPAGAAVGRPCQGSASWATGIGSITDSSTANGATFEGYGAEANAGSTGVTGGYVAIYIRTKPAPASAPLGSAANPAASCKAIRDAGAAGASGLYHLTGATIGRFRAWCDFGSDIDGGGWTLVMSTNSGTAWSGFAGAWWTNVSDFPGTTGTVAPTSYGKNPAWFQVSGTELVFRTHNEAAGRWARYALPSNTTVATLLGTTNLSSQAAGYKATLTKVAVGGTAVACWNTDWRVNWRSYGSSDSALDSSVFAPGTLTSSFRPCGGNTAYATGVGVQTDSSGAYGGSFEGYGSDLSGNPAVTGGYVSIYVR